jgi:YjbE family integral membrane protein
MDLDASFFLGLLQIIWINILLSGDNAVVIALACRSLPPRQQKLGIILGTVPAVVLRIIFAAVIAYLMMIPYLKLVGGLLLLWIAVDLLKQGEEEEAHVREGGSLWTAVRTIVVADAVMSLDNVIAIAAAANGSMVLLVLGLVISMPLVIFGSALLLKVLERFPILVTAGGALLGYIAGEVIVTDPATEQWIAAHAHVLGTVLPIGLAVAVVVVGHLIGRLSAQRRKQEEANIAS